MDKINKFLLDNWQTLVVMVSVYVFGFFTSYLRERVKNRAYLADIKRLENEKELVRKEHQLDIEKRKYKYESKREQFVKYFNLIDDFTAQSNKDIQSRFLPMMTSYTQEYLNGYGDKEKETEAITKFSSGIQTLMFEANENLIRLRGETNAIKIIADKRTVELINQMDKLYDKSFDLTALMIKELSSAVTTQDFSGVTQIESELKVYTDKILETKELMIEQIRTELDEI